MDKTAIQATKMTADAEKAMPNSGEKFILTYSESGQPQIEGDTDGCVSQPVQGDIETLWSEYVNFWDNGASTRSLVSITDCRGDEPLILTGHDMRELLLNARKACADHERGATGALPINYFSHDY